MSGLPHPGVASPRGYLTQGLPHPGVTSPRGYAAQGLPHPGVASPRGYLTQGLPHPGVTSPRGCLTQGLPHPGVTSPRGYLTQGLPHPGVHIDLASTLNNQYILRDLNRNGSFRCHGNLGHGHIETSTPHQEMYPQILEVIDAILKKILFVQR